VVWKSERAVEVALTHERAQLDERTAQLGKTDVDIHE